MKFLKENWKMLIIIFIIATLFPIIILYPSNYGVIPHDIGLQIVGYGGSILGGFLTLYGVWWTIRDNESRHHKDLTIEYMPFLECEINYEMIAQNDIPMHIGLSICYDKNSKEKYASLNFPYKFFKIRNSGRGIAYIEEYKILNHSTNSEIFTSKSYSFYIPPGKEINLVFGTSEYDKKERQKLIGDDTKHSINFDLILKYYNEFDTSHQNPIKMFINFNGEFNYKNDICDKKNFKWESDDEYEYYLNYSIKNYCVSYSNIDKLHKQEERDEY